MLEHSCAPARAQAVAHPALKNPGGRMEDGMERPLGRGARGARGEYILGFLSFPENRAPPACPLIMKIPGGAWKRPPAPPGVVHCEFRLAGRRAGAQL